VYSSADPQPDYIIIINIYSAINQLVPNIEIKDLGFVRVGFDSALMFHTMADPALPTVSESPVQFALLYATFHMYSLKFCEHVKKKREYISKVFDIDIEIKTYHPACRWESIQTLESVCR
jgi:hypothetical protein